MRITPIIWNFEAYQENPIWDWQMPRLIAILFMSGLNRGFLLYLTVCIFSNALIV